MADSLVFTYPIRFRSFMDCRYEELNTSPLSLAFHRRIHSYAAASSTDGSFDNCCPAQYLTAYLYHTILADHTFTIPVCQYNRRELSSLGIRDDYWFKYACGSTERTASVQPRASGAAG